MTNPASPKTLGDIINRTVRLERSNPAGPFTTGDLDAPYSTPEKGTWTAGIDRPGHGSCVECHAETQAEAERLRDVCLRALVAAGSAGAVEATAEPVAQWRPIETAPKDGREVVLAVKYRAGIPRGVLVGHYMSGGHCIEDHPPIDAGWYFWNGCMFDKAAHPTHWMPLPDHPEWKSGDWQHSKQHPKEPK